MSTPRSETRGCGDSAENVTVPACTTWSAALAGRADDSATALARIRFHASVDSGGGRAAYSRYRRLIGRRGAQAPSRPAIAGRELRARRADRGSFARWLLARGPAAESFQSWESVGRLAGQSKFGNRFQRPLSMSVRALSSMFRDSQRYGGR